MRVLHLLSFNSLRKAKFILILIFLSAKVYSFQNADTSSISTADSIIFTDFDGSNYRASSYNNMSIVDEDGIVYFGNENGLLEFDGTHWQLYKTPNFSPVIYLKLIEDKIYTFGNNTLGYFQRDQTGNMVYHSLSEKMPDKKEIPFVWNIIQDEGNTYFSLDSSLLKWDGEILERLNLDRSIAAYPINDEILVSIYGKDGGLAVLKDDTLSMVNTEFAFKNDYVWDVVQQRDGNYLLFTSEEGIFNLNPKNYKTTEFDSEINDFYKSDSSYFYYAEKISDSLFISSSWYRGLQLFNHKGEILKHVNKKAGLLNNYVTHPNVDRRGNVWLSGTYGIQYLQFNDSDEQFDFQPAAKIRYLKVADSSIYIRESGHFISFPTEEFNSIDFYFSVPSFFEKDLKFSYYLEGLEDGWSDWTTNSRKEYTNLSGGKYTMHLRAKHANLDQLDIKSFEFSFQIPTPWYQHPLTYFLLAIAVGGAIFGFIRLRTHRLSIANKKLEAVVRERTSELSTQKEQLKAANEELKTINNELDNFVYRSSHDLVAPLKSLRGLITVAGMSNDSNEIKDYFKLMNTSINKLEEFIRSIMDFSTNTKKPLEMRSVGLDDILNSIVEDLKFYENAEKVELIRAYDSDFEIKTDPKRLNIVLSNLVTNALKYHDFKKDEDPYIKVAAKIEDNSYIIQVEDNGSGIPEEHQTKIFDMFFRAHQGTEGSGLGLYIVMDTLNVLKGKISLKSKTREGTTFTVTLPVVD